MVRIELAPGVLDDIDRFINRLRRHEAEKVEDRIDEILEAIRILVHSPMIGRPVANGKRELVIGDGRRGYVALYRYMAEIQTVFVLALRAQRASGFKH